MTTQPFNKFVRQDMSTELETLVDRYGLSNLISVLAIVCEAKTDHIRANWQDKTTANVWAYSSRDLDKIAERFKARGL